MSLTGSLIPHLFRDGRRAGFGVYDACPRFFFFFLNYIRLTVFSAVRGLFLNFYSGCNTFSSFSLFLTFILTFSLLLLFQRATSYLRLSEVSIFSHFRGKTTLHPRRRRHVVGTRRS